ncbi:unnamed protein product [Owenia fusiformis]|uniref:[histone H3]-lysine(36) N-trimethyltransferase n=1 Tax=Owenia fusiformis TaxID=6347 RepID=A0A8S4P6V8_OWEFU|nr:unnamed protein product [Owenia fusiformis]
MDMDLDAIPLPGQPETKAKVDTSKSGASRDAVVKKDKPTGPVKIQRKSRFSFSSPKPKNPEESPSDVKPSEPAVKVNEPSKLITPVVSTMDKTMTKAQKLLREKQQQFLVKQRTPSQLDLQQKGSTKISFAIKGKKNLVTYDDSESSQNEDEKSDAKTGRMEELIQSKSAAKLNKTSPPKVKDKPKKTDHGESQIKPVSSDSIKIRSSEASEDKITTNTENLTKLKSRSEKPIKDDNKNAGVEESKQKDNEKLNEETEISSAKSTSAVKNTKEQETRYSSRSRKGRSRSKSSEKLRKRSSQKRSRSRSPKKSRSKTPKRQHRRHSHSRSPKRTSSRASNRYRSRSQSSEKSPSYSRKDRKSSQRRGRRSPSSKSYRSSNRHSMSGSSDSSPDNTTRRKKTLSRSPTSKRQSRRSRSKSKEKRRDSRQHRNKRSHSRSKDCSIERSIITNEERSSSKSKKHRDREQNYEKEMDSDGQSTDNIKNKSKLKKKNEKDRSASPEDKYSSRKSKKGDKYKISERFGNRDSSEHRSRKKNKQRRRSYSSSSQSSASSVDETKERRTSRNRSPDQSKSSKEFTNNEVLKDSSKDKSRHRSKDESNSKRKSPTAQSDEKQTTKGKGHERKDSIQDDIEIALPSKSKWDTDSDSDNATSFISRFDRNDPKAPDVCKERSIPDIEMKRYTSPSESRGRKSTSRSARYKSKSPERKESKSSKSETSVIRDKVSSRISKSPDRQLHDRRKSPIHRRHSKEHKVGDDKRKSSVSPELKSSNSGSSLGRRSKHRSRSFERAHVASKDRKSDKKSHHKHKSNSSDSDRSLSPMEVSKDDKNKKGGDKERKTSKKRSTISPTGRKQTRNSLDGSSKYRDSSPDSISSRYRSPEQKQKDKSEKKRLKEKPVDEPKIKLKSKLDKKSYDDGSCSEEEDPYPKKSSKHKKKKSKHKKRKRKSLDELIDKYIANLDSDLDDHSGANEADMFSDNSDKDRDHSKKSKKKKKHKSSPTYSPEMDLSPVYSRKSYKSSKYSTDDTDEDERFEYTKAKKHKKTRSELTDQDSKKDKQETHSITAKSSDILKEMELSKYEDYMDTKSRHKEKDRNRSSNIDNFSYDERKRKMSVEIRSSKSKNKHRSPSYEEKIEKKKHALRSPSLEDTKSGSGDRRKERYRSRTPPLEKHNDQRKGRYRSRSRSSSVEKKRSISSKKQKERYRSPSLEKKQSVSDDKRKQRSRSRSLSLDRTSSSSYKQKERYSPLLEKMQSRSHKRNEKCNSRSPSVDKEQSVSSSKGKHRNKSISEEQSQLIYESRKESRRKESQPVQERVKKYETKDSADYEIASDSKRRDVSPTTHVVEPKLDVKSRVERTKDMQRSRRISEPKSMDISSNDQLETERFKAAEEKDPEPYSPSARDEGRYSLTPSPVPQRHTFEDKLDVKVKPSIKEDVDEAPSSSYSSSSEDSSSSDDDSTSSDSSDSSSSEDDDDEEEQAPPPPPPPVQKKISPPPVPRIPSPPPVQRFKGNICQVQSLDVSSLSNKVEIATKVKEHQKVQDSTISGSELFTDELKQKSMQDYDSKRDSDFNLGKLSKETEEKAKPDKGSDFNRKPSSASDFSSKTMKETESHRKPVETRKNRSRDRSREKRDKHSRDRSRERRDERSRGRSRERRDGRSMDRSRERDDRKRYRDDSRERRSGRTRRYDDKEVSKKKKVEPVIVLDDADDVMEIDEVPPPPPPPRKQPSVPSIDLGSIPIPLDSIPLPPMKGVPAATMPEMPLPPAPVLKETTPQPPSQLPPPPPPDSISQQPKVETIQAALQPPAANVEIPSVDLPLPKVEPSSDISTVQLGSQQTHGPADSSTPNRPVPEVTHTVSPASNKIAEAMAKLAAAKKPASSRWDAKSKLSTQTIKINPKIQFTENQAAVAADSTTSEPIAKFGMMKKIIPKSSKIQMTLKTSLGKFKTLSAFQADDEPEEQLSQLPSLRLRAASKPAESLKKLETITKAEPEKPDILENKIDDKQKETREESQERAVSERKSRRDSSKDRRDERRSRRDSRERGRDRRRSDSREHRRRERSYERREERRSRRDDSRERKRSRRDGSRERRRYRSRDRSRGKSVEKPSEDVSNENVSKTEDMNEKSKLEDHDTKDTATFETDNSVSKAEQVLTTKPSVPESEVYDPFSESAPATPEPLKKEDEPNTLIGYPAEILDRIVKHDTLQEKQMGNIVQTSETPLTNAESYAEQQQKYASREGTPCLDEPGDGVNNPVQEMQNQQGVMMLNYQALGQTFPEDTGFGQFSHSQELSRPTYHQDGGMQQGLGPKRSPSPRRADLGKSGSRRSQSRSKSRGRYSRSLSPRRASRRRSYGRDSPRRSRRSQSPRRNSRSPRRRSRSPRRRSRSPRRRSRRSRSRERRYSSSPENRKSGSSRRRSRDRTPAAYRRRRYSRSVSRERWRRRSRSPRRSSRSPRRRTRSPRRRSRSPRRSSRSPRRSSRSPRNRRSGFSPRDRRRRSMSRSRSPDRTRKSAKEMSPKPKQNLDWLLKPDKTISQSPMFQGSSQPTLEEQQQQFIAQNQLAGIPLPPQGIPLPGVGIAPPTSSLVVPLVSGDTGSGRHIAPHQEAPVPPIPIEPPEHQIPLAERISRMLNPDTPPPPAPPAPVPSIQHGPPTHPPPSQHTQHMFMPQSQYGMPPPSLLTPSDLISHPPPPPQYPGYAQQDEYSNYYQQPPPMPLQTEPPPVPKKQPEQPQVSVPTHTSLTHSPSRSPKKELKEDSEVSIKTRKNDIQPSDTSDMELEDAADEKIQTAEQSEPNIDEITSKNEPSEQEETNDSKMLFPHIGASPTIEDENSSETPTRKDADNEQRTGTPTPSFPSDFAEVTPSTTKSSKKKKGRKSLASENDVDTNSENDTPSRRRSSRLKSLEVKKGKEEKGGTIKKDKKEKKERKKKEEEQKEEEREPLSPTTVTFTKERKDFVVPDYLRRESLNNTSEVNQNDESPKCMKMKSRWLQASALEGFSAVPSSSPPPPESDTDAKLDVFKEDDDVKREFTGNDTSNIIPPAVEEDEDLPERPTFEEIKENIFLSERKKSKAKKEARRMLCDCTTSKEDRKMGMLPCGDDCLNRMLMIECGSRCPCGDYCTNKRFQRLENANVAPFRTDWKGWGLQAEEEIKPDTFVMEYVGEVLDYKQFTKRTKQYAREGQAHYYFMALNTDEIIDAWSKGNVSRFINHSCDPNCETQKWTVNGQLRVGFFAIKDIKPGTEITFDYQWERYGKEAQKCYCGSDNCRGILGGEKRQTLKSSKKRKSSTERKPVVDIFDDSLEEDIERMVSLDGLKNKQHVLTLSRLMVRCETADHRLALLRLLQSPNTEPACLRLFIDYHGLSLMWSWMVDLGKEFRTELKSQILNTLRRLPITNKNVLKDSKIITVVEKWSREVDEKEADDSQSEAPSGSQTPLTLSQTSSMLGASQSGLNSSQITLNIGETSDTPPPPDVSSELYSRLLNKKRKLLPGQRGEEASGSDSDFSDSSKLSAIADNSSQHSSHTPVKSKPDTEPKVLEPKVKYGERGNIFDIVANEIKNESFSEDLPDTQPPEAETIIEDAKVESTTDDNLTEVEGQGEGHSQDEAQTESQEDGESSKEPNICNFASDLLESWSGLKELFKIPKKQLVEERKRTEEELDRQNREKIDSRRDSDKLDSYSEYNRRNRDRDRDRKRRHGDSPEGRSSKHSRDDRKDRRSRDSRSSFPTTPKGSMSKEERRSLFEAQVKAKEELDRIIQEQEQKRQQQQQLQHEADMVEMQYRALQEPSAVFQDPTTGAMVIQDPTLLPDQVVIQDQLHQDQLFQDPNVLMQQQFQDPSGAMYTTEAVYQDPTTGQLIMQVPQASQSSVQHGFVDPNTQVVYQTQVQVPSQQTQVTQGYIQSQPQIQQVAGQQVYYQTPQGVVVQQQYPSQTAGQSVSQVQQVPVQSLEQRLESEAVPGDLPPPPPSPPAKIKPVKLPPNWKTAKDADNKTYYYHTVTRQTQWDPPQWDGAEGQDVDLYDTPDYQEHSKKHQRRTTTAPADTSSENARRLKEKFRSNMSSHIVACLNSYRKPDCKRGRITTTEEFKHLARKLTHTVLAKELKHCRHEEDLEVNESVKAKARDYVKKYMSKFGNIYKKAPSPLENF